MIATGDLCTLEDMSTVTLTELDEIAPLQTRSDHKYMVPLAELDGLLGSIGSEMLALDIGGHRSFRYESVYFDTPDHRSYLDAARSRPRRCKVRTRSYLDSGLCALEVKARSPRDLTVKHRSPYRMQDRGRLTAAGHSFIFDMVGMDLPTDSLAHSLTTTYDRSTLLIATSSSRVTIDTDLVCTQPSGAEVRLDNYAILETKSATGVSLVDRELWSRRYRPLNISKYCTGMAALNPGLGANKWNRVLRRYFNWSPQPRP